MIYLLLAFIAVTLSALFEMLFAINVIPSVNYGLTLSLGFLFFLTTQSIILSINFSESFIKTENLTYQLKEYSSKLEEKVIERTQELNDAHEEKINFYINVAHETKTPLTLISHSLERISERNQNDTDFLMVRNNIDKLKNNMIGLLDLRKFEKGQFVFDHNQVVFLSQILDERIRMYHSLALKKSIKIHSHIESNIYIKISPLAIDRVINNIIDNAIRYTNQFGEIKIDLAKREDRVYFSVKDNGIGIDPEQKKYIFENYYQASHTKKNTSGLGIGLNIVKYIADSVDAVIQIDSELDQGTTVIVNFKSCEVVDPAMITFDTEHSSLIDLNLQGPLPTVKVHNELKKTLIYVEDNYEMIRFLYDSLSTKYNFYYATDGMEALELIKTMPKPDLVISDIMMDQMNGYDFFYQLKKSPEFAHIPFIFLTAINTTELKVKFISEGAVDFISKPFLINELEAKIKSILLNRDIQIEKHSEHIETEIFKVLKGVNHQNISMVNEKEKLTTNMLEITCRDYNVTARQKEILVLLQKNLTYKEIGINLGISENTVKTQVQRLKVVSDCYTKNDLLNLFFPNYSNK